MAFLTYFASHWTLVIACVLGVVGLGAAAYVFKNLKFAIAAVALAVAGFLYQGAVTSGIQLQMAKEKAELVKMYQGRIALMNTVATNDAAQAQINADRIEKLERDAEQTPANDRVCFDLDATRRV